MPEIVVVPTNNTFLGIDFDVDRDMHDRYELHTLHPVSGGKIEFTLTLNDNSSLQDPEVGWAELWTMNNSDTSSANINLSRHSGNNFSLQLNTNKNNEYLEIYFDNAGVASPYSLDGISDPRILAMLQQLGLPSELPEDNRVIDDQGPIFGHQRLITKMSELYKKWTGQATVIAGRV